MAGAPLERADSKLFRSFERGRLKAQTAAALTNFRICATLTMPLLAGVVNVAGSFASRDASLFTVGGLLIFFAATAWAYLWSCQRRLLGRYEESEKLREIRPGQARALWAMVAELAGRMSIDPRGVRLWLARRGEGEGPSVVETGGRVQVVVPLAFLSLAARCPGVARAMLLHEFGHVRQADTQLWALSSAFAPVYRRVLLPTMALGSLVNLHAAQRLTESELISAAVESFAPLILSLLFYRGILIARRRAEAGADLAALMYCGADDLIAALRSSGSPRGCGLMFGLHPSVQRRIEAIRKTSRGSADAPPQAADAEPTFVHPRLTHGRARAGYVFATMVLLAAAVHTLAIALFNPAVMFDRGKMPYVMTTLFLAGLVKLGFSLVRSWKDEDSFADAHIWIEAPENIPFEDNRSMGRRLLPLLWLCRADNATDLGHLLAVNRCLAAIMRARYTFRRTLHHFIIYAILLSGLTDFIIICEELCNNVSLVVVLSPTVEHAIVDTLAAVASGLSNLDVLRLALVFAGWMMFAQAIVHSLEASLMERIDCWIVELLTATRWTPSVPGMKSCTKFRRHV